MGGGTNFRGVNAAGVTTISLNNEGDAIFAGTVTANGSVLTRAAGNLDVGERLEKADAALKALKTAALAATDFDSLKQAILISLEDV